MSNVRKRAMIAGIASYLPDKVLDNDELSQMVDTSDEWIVKRTGIKERRIEAENKPSSWMGIQAVKNLLEKTNTDPKEIDLLICGTSTADMRFPAVGIKIAHETGCLNAASFDVQAGCSAFAHILILASQFIETGYYKKIVVLGVEKMSSVVDYTDRRNCILFGDAGGAALVVPSDNPEIGILDSKLYSDGHPDNIAALHLRGGSLEVPAAENDKAQRHFIHQNGSNVFKKAVEAMGNVALELLARHGLVAEDIDWFVAHQANLRIIDAVMKNVGIAEEKVLTNIQKYGNTSSASIPLCLTDFEKSLKKGDKMCISAFGAGYAWAGIYLVWGYDS